MLVHELIYRGERERTVFHGKENVTYGDLQQKVMLFRNYLYRAGVRPGDRVGLLARNSPAFVYAYMAVVSLGAVVVPVNHQLTAQEVAYLITDAGMKDFITMTKLALAEPLLEYGYSTPVTQHVLADIGNRPEDFPAGETAPDLDGAIDENAMCTIIYTSGTTGKPKGAMLTHRNLISDAISFTRVLPVQRDDNVLCVLPLYHCFAWTCAMLCSLLHKASITLMDTVIPKEIIENIKSRGITIMYGVPSIYMLLLKTATAADLAGVRLFVSGGASLPKQVAANFYRTYGKNITEGYGLSEASPVVTFNPPQEPKYMSIGLPIPGMEVKILDDQGRELPIGIVGELVTRGANVMKGYLNRPQETAAVLRDGWLHTGDLAYRDEEGYLFIVDRLKDMIITMGENIYPREIEEVLYTYPGVVEAAVVGVPDSLRGQAVRAYIVLAEGQSLDKKAVKNYLRGKLAPYKIPRDFIQMEVLPKNQSGKILKRALNGAEV